MGHAEFFDWWFGAEQFQRVRQLHQTQPGGLWRKLDQRSWQQFRTAERDSGVHHSDSIELNHKERFGALRQQRQDGDREDQSGLRAGSGTRRYRDRLLGRLSVTN